MSDNITLDIKGPPSIDALNNNYNPSININRYNTVYNIFSSLKEDCRNMLNLSTFTHIPYLSAQKPSIPIFRYMAKTAPITQSSSIFTFEMVDRYSAISSMYLRVRISPLVIKGPYRREAAARWSCFPGHRLIKRGSMSINGTDIDVIDREVMNLYYSKYVSAEEQELYRRCVGQQNIINGVGERWPIMNNNIIQYSPVNQFTNGNQTYKADHESLDLYIPLPFWFYKNTVPFPIGKVNSQTKVLFTFEINEIASLISWVSNINMSGLPFDIPVVTNVELYTNYLMYPGIMNMALKNIKYTNYSANEQFYQTITDTTTTIDLDNIDRSVESLTIGFRPRANANDPINWNRNAILNKEYPITLSVDANNTVQPLESTVTFESPIISDLSIKYNTADLDRYTSQKAYSDLVVLSSNFIKNNDDNIWYYFDMSTGSDTASCYVNPKRVGMKIYVNSDYASLATPVDVIILVKYLSVIDHTDTYDEFKPI